MDYRKKFLVEPGSKVNLGKIDPAFTGDHESRETAMPEIQKNVDRLTRDQYLLWADGERALLVVLQALDAGGKDGVVRHVFSATNPEGTSVASFKEPNRVEAAQDFLWRVHRRVPHKGELVIFNRSHYEDVLIARVHKAIKKKVWSKRYDLINGFEKLLTANGTRVLKFYLHISPEEQLERFKQRLDDPTRHWKISEADYTERDRWPQYREAYEDVLEKTSTAEAPWFVIPADRKWFRDLAVSRIIADTMDDMGLRIPPPHVDLDAIRRKYHAEEKELRGRGAAFARRRGGN